MYKKNNLKNNLSIVLILILLEVTQIVSAQDKVQRVLS